MNDRKLALAVIVQAIEDAQNPRISLRTRVDAAEFLVGRRSTAWCRIAGVRPWALQEAARSSLRRLLAS
jgi:hypothetical protein